MKFLSTKFWFLVCYAATQLATQLKQRCLQLVCSNKEARKRLTESNCTSAMDLVQKLPNFVRYLLHCCSLPTSTSNPYSRGTSQQMVPGSSTKGTRPVWPNFPNNNRGHPHSWQQITDKRTEMTKTFFLDHICVRTCRMRGNCGYIVCMLEGRTGTRVYTTIRVCQRTGVVSSLAV